MYITDAMKLAILNLTRRKLKSVLNLTINTTIIVLQLCVCVFTLSSFYYLNNSLNDINGEEIYRELSVQYDYENSTDFDKDILIGELKNNTHIEEVTVQYEDIKKNIMLKIRLDDYRSIQTVVKQLSEKKGYTLFVNENATNSLEKVEVIKIVNLCIILIVLVLSAITMIVNITRLMNDRIYVFALMKAVGYQEKHLCQIIYIEITMMLLISYSIAIIITKILLNIVSNVISTQWVEFRMITSNLRIDGKTILLTLIITLMFGFLGSRYLLRRIRKIPPFVLLK